MNPNHPPDPPKKPWHPPQIEPIDDDLPEGEPAAEEEEDA